MSRTRIGAVVALAAASLLMILSGRARLGWFDPVVFWTALALNVLALALMIREFRASSKDRGRASARRRTKALCALAAAALLATLAAGCSTHHAPSSRQEDPSFSLAGEVASQNGLTILNRISSLTETIPPDMSRPGVRRSGQFSSMEGHLQANGFAIARHRGEVVLVERYLLKERLREDPLELVVISRAGQLIGAVVDTSLDPGWIHFHFLKKLLKPNEPTGPLMTSVPSFRSVKRRERIAVAPGTTVTVPPGWVGDWYSRWASESGKATSVEPIRVLDLGMGLGGKKRDWKEIWVEAYGSRTDARRASMSPTRATMSPSVLTTRPALVLRRAAGRAEARLAEPETGTHGLSQTTEIIFVPRAGGEVIRVVLLVEYASELPDDSAARKAAAESLLDDLGL